MIPVDDIFDDPRLAAMYDPLDPDRSDLDVYVAIADELGARRVLDVGCGTGTFALMLAGKGLEVTGVDPAKASLDVARAKPGAERVSWIHGDASALPALEVDLATMTGNAAQAIVDEHMWDGTLRGIFDTLRPGGHFVFETRDPAYEAWREWTRDDFLRDLGDRWRRPGRELGRAHSRGTTARHLSLDLRLPRRRRVDIRLDAAIS